MLCDHKHNNVCEHLMLFHVWLLLHAYTVTSSLSLNISSSLYDIFQAHTQCAHTGSTMPYTCLVSALDCPTTTLGEHGNTVS